MKINKGLKYIFWSFSVLILSGCEPKTEITVTPEEYHAAVDKVTAIMVNDIFSPPQASRVYVYPNIAAYQVLNSNSGEYASLTPQLNGFREFAPTVKSESGTNLELSALIAYLQVAEQLVFSDNEIREYRDSLYQKWEQQNPESLERAKIYADKVASSVIEWMEADHYHETRSMPDYDFFDESPERWQPTPPGYMKGIEPHWSKIRPMVLDSAAQFKPNPPPAFSLNKDSDFFKELEEVYLISKTIRAKGNDSPEIKIARFWDCNPYVSITKGHYMFAEKKITPGAHWMGICKIAALQSEADFDFTVYAYTKTSIAIFDAFISCWDEKYRSNLIRPETLIAEHIDKDWQPILQTPPFPEYSSGHSVVSNAAAKVLTSIFGDDFEFEDTTEVAYGLPVRKFDSFNAAALEATMSRLYGGIHYRSAIEEGAVQGENVGSHINSRLNFSLTTKEQELAIARP
ncbi:vanadium-dependent haloperoxidase [Salinimicrobium xinjiangense]|uniref:vanadium-dependent haloperoxidase n=1 Tax=Salinimicrobium xinjiangense TaxID=438596 RepID=UPI00040F5C55|nr:vanadium-dependent haloperoxidase [Salinimicrobium xinjiangense]